MLTYGDGVCDVNLKKLLRFHKKNKYMATLTAVRPPARFGGIKISKNTVKYFKEKSKLDAGWINGGFFVFEYAFLKYIKNDETFLEKEPLEKLSKEKKLVGYKHTKVVHCTYIYIYNPIYNICYILHLNSQNEIVIGCKWCKYLAMIGDKLTDNIDKKIKI